MIPFLKCRVFVQYFFMLQCRASAIAQSGFKLEGDYFFVRYYRAVVHPPFRGVLATVLGMSWARGAIFYGSEAGSLFL